MITGVHARLSQLPPDIQERILLTLTESELSRLLYLRHAYLIGEIVSDTTPSEWTITAAISYCEGML